MIKLIVGAAGTGKTKMLTRLANEDVKKPGGIWFILIIRKGAC
ncbi:MAG TPA: hypothetical protein VFC98_03955 [Clostridia bacterium]|nr:hypothetical protein [Clostridia bacterium]